MSGFEMELEIARLGAHGDGVADIDGKLIFVPFTAPGDKARVRLGGGKNSRPEGRMLELLQGGPDRQDPLCAHFGKCGGCAFQHLTMKSYTDWKLARLMEILDRAGLQPDSVLPLVQAEPGTRRRADLTFMRRQADVLVGFNEARSHRIVDMSECPVMLPKIAALLGPMRSALFDFLQPGEGGEAKVTATDSGLDLLIVTGAKLGPMGRQRLVDLAADQDLARVSRGHPKQEGAEVVVERRPVRMVFGGITVGLPPWSFLQATATGEAALSDFITDAAKGATWVADLYCGVGTFALPVAANGCTVEAFDVNERQVNALRAAAHGHPLPKLSATVRNLNRRPLSAEDLAGGDLVIFDPPRSGAKTQAPEIAKSGVPRIAAISCNPASFARDAEALVEGGYRLTRLQPVDQFLWSPHLELAALFEL